MLNPSPSPDRLKLGSIQQMEQLHFPLSDSGQKELQALCKRLWGWQDCEACLRSQPCPNAACPWRRTSRLERFFQYYKDATRSFIPELFVSDRPLLSTHDDILSIIEQIQKSGDVPRSGLIAAHKEKTSDADTAGEEDDGREFELVVRVATMINCSGSSMGWRSWRGGDRPIQWASGMSCNDFLREAFPKSLETKFDETDGSLASRQLFKSVRATKLTAVAGLRFRPTDDLAQHLRLDPRTGTVDIFHHTAVLKEHLRCSRLSGCAETGSRTELIPRQVALEVIDSIQNVLFPPDFKSQSLLKSLVETQDFDEDCLRPERSTYCREGEHHTTYHHFGTRLEALYEEVRDPTPRHILEKWLERRSAARHIMMATLCGVFAAVILGFCALAFQIWQSVMTHEQLKLALEEHRKAGE